MMVVKKKTQTKKTKQISKKPKITSKKEKDTIKYIIYCAIIFMGFFLILAFSSKLIDTGDDNYYSYHGFDFIESNDMVQTQIQLKTDKTKLYTIELRYGPRDVKDIPIIGEPHYFVLPEEMYVAFDPEEENLQYIGVATADIQMNLIKVLGKKLTAACIKESEECGDTLVRDCGNSELPIIIVRSDPVALVEQKGNCLYVQGPDMDVIRAADRFLLYLYGIMDE